MLRYSALTIIGLGLSVAALTALWRIMLAFIAIGSCASSPIYEIAQSCPEQMPALFGLLFAALIALPIGLGLYALRARAHPAGRDSARDDWRRGPELAALWWPVLFLGGAAMFVHLALLTDATTTTQPATMRAVFYTCASLFVPLAAIPLLVFARHLPVLLLGGPESRPRSLIQPYDGRLAQRMNAFQARHGFGIAVETGGWTPQRAAPGPASIADGWRRALAGLGSAPRLYMLALHLAVIVLAARITVDLLAPLPP